MHRVLNTWTKVWTGHHSKICTFKYTAYVTFPMQDGPKISSGHHSEDMYLQVYCICHFANAAHLKLFKQWRESGDPSLPFPPYLPLPPLPSLPLSPPNPSPSLLLLTTCIWKHSRTRRNIHSFQYFARFIQKLRQYNLKGTVSRDFLLLVFFMNQFPPSSRVFQLDRFEFFRKFRIKIRIRFRIRIRIMIRIRIQNVIFRSESDPDPAKSLRIRIQNTPSTDK
jgi:hypothetical protein